MKSQANITVNANSILVRFRSRNFYEIVERWKATFPQAEFNRKTKVWELPIANFERVRQFCNEYFWEVKVNSSDNVKSKPQQLRLTFE